LKFYFAALSDLQAIPVGSIPTDCHPSSIITNLGVTPPFSKLKQKERNINSISYAQINKLFIIE
jgi:hypothetical protein